MGDDLPPSFPLTLGREVEIVVEESMHYALGAPGAEDEWCSGKNVGFDAAGCVGTDT